MVVVEGIVLPEHQVVLLARRTIGTLHEATQRIPCRSSPADPFLGRWAALCCAGGGRARPLAQALQGRHDAVEHGVGVARGPKVATVPALIATITTLIATITTLIATISTLIATIAALIATIAALIATIAALIATIAALRVDDQYPNCDNQYPARTWLGRGQIDLGLAASRVGRRWTMDAKERVHRRTVERKEPLEALHGHRAG